MSLSLSSELRLYSYHVTWVSIWFVGLNNCPQSRLAQFLWIPEELSVTTVCQVRSYLVINNRKPNYVLPIKEFRWLWPHKLTPFPLPFCLPQWSGPFLVLHHDSNMAAAALGFTSTFQGERRRKGKMASEYASQVHPCGKISQKVPTTSHWQKLY